MDDLIIIILTLLFTIFAAINQTKKKKIPEPKIPEPWKIPGGFKPSGPFPQEKPVRKNDEKTIQPRKTSAAFLQVETFEEEGIRNETVASIVNKQMDKNETVPEESPVMEDFSLRKAIIFTEIIKPKYF